MTISRPKFVPSSSTNTSTTRPDRFWSTNRMRRFSDRHTLQTLTEINVTPLLDLAFVLLIIFIITTPLMENSVNLVVPTSGEATQPVDPSQVQTISMDKEGVMRMNGEIVDRETLEARLVALHAEK